MAFVLVNARRTAVGSARHRFFFWMHFIKPIYVIEPFAIVRAAILLILTAAVGFVISDRYSH
jgi:hypothetical protein